MSNSFAWVLTREAAWKEFVDPLTRNYYSGDVRDYVGHEHDLVSEPEDVKRNAKTNFRSPWLVELRHKRNEPIAIAIGIIEHIRSNIAMYSGEDIKILFFKFLKIFGPVRTPRCFLICCL